MNTNLKEPDGLVTSRGDTMENTLLALWKRVLKVNVIDPDTSFLNLGGHSADAIQIVTGIESAFSIRIPVIALFQHDTITRLAAYLKAQGQDQGKNIQSSRKPYHSHRYSPLTAMQKSLYFVSQTGEAHAIAYHIPCVLDIVGSLDVGILSESIHLLVKRHAVLRTLFHESAQGVIQTCVDPMHSAIQIQTETVSLDQLEEKTLAVVQAPIPLHRFPLLRVQLFKITDHRHRLVMVQPHIITDGVSLRILTDELFTIYDARTASRSPRMPAIPITYLDYVQRDACCHVMHARDIDFWKSQLDGLQHVTFPYDYARPSKPDYVGRRQTFSVHQTQWKQLNRMSADHNVTPFMWIAAVLHLLLSRYCHQEDIVIGFPHALRGHADLSSTVGPLINTLALRTQISATHAFSQLLQHVKSQCLQAYAHATVPLPALLTALNTPHEAGRHPLFDVVLVWQDWYVPTAVYPESGITVTPKVCDTRTAKFDMTFEFIPTDMGLQGSIEYKSGLLHPDTVARLADQVVDLLMQSMTSPEKILADFSLIHPPKAAAYLPKQQMAPLAIPCLPHQAFETHVVQCPNSIALIAAQATLCYAELNRRANQLAHYIRTQYLAAFTSDTPPFIGIFLNKGENVIISILAVLKAGAAYVPIDTRSPAQRIQFIASDANLSLIITQATDTAPLKGVGRPLLCLDQVMDAVAGHTVANPDMPIALEAPMYVIYTSGTTGQPKGVIQTHKNVARLFQVTASLFGFNAQDTGLFFHSHAFDFSVWEIWGALHYGGRLVIPSEAALVDPHLLVQLIKRHHITVLNQTPSAFRGFMPTFIAQSLDLVSLRTVVFGGEAFNIHLLTEWWQHFSDQRPHMINMYGITETTVHTTYRLLSKADLHRRESSNIGVPLDDMQGMVVDMKGRMVSVGVPGELLVGGEGLALGYVNQPVLTDKKFIKQRCPLTQRMTRFYRTGDLVRYLSDNTFEYLGRIDQQIQFKGFRIEKGDIESALQRHPDIALAAVAVKPYHDTHKLVAYYTCQQDGQPPHDPATLRRFLSAQLPSYMLPNLWVKLDAMPLTVNMKTHYAALPEITSITPDNLSDTRQSVAACTPPMTASQQRLVAIWEANLPVQSIGLDDNFFRLGGDSITVLKVVAQACSQGFSLRVSDMYRYPTIREIVQHSEENGAVSPIPVPACDVAFSGINTVDREQLPHDAVDAYPMASLQLGMLYHTRYAPNKAVYVDVFSYWIAGAYTHTHFLQALQQLVATHPILRTTLHVDTYSLPLQVVHASLNPVVTVASITQDPQAQDSALQAWQHTQKMTSIPFETGPLFHLTIHVLSPHSFHLGLTFHHAILDGWSVATFMTALLDLYACACAGQSMVLPTPPPYRAFIQREQMACQSQSQKQFWERELAGCEGTVLWQWPCPLDAPPATDFLTHTVDFDSGLTQSLLALANTLQVSLDVLLLTGFIKLLAVLTDSEDILAGVVFNGRPSLSGTENSLGLFLNTLPFRHRLLPGSWQRLISAVSQQKSGLYPYRRYPLMQIQQDLGVEQLFTVLFYFTHFHVYAAPAHVSSCPFKIVRQTFYERTNFPLAFHFSLNGRGDALSLAIRHDTHAYPTVQVHALSRYLMVIFDQMVADSQADHTDCRVMDRQETQRILVDWNQTAVDYDCHLPIHGLIERQAQKTPHAIAVQSQGQALTYAALHAQSNAVAHALKEQGAGPGHAIAVYMPRTVEAIVAVLAVFKLGGVYVPVDMRQPVARVNAILDTVGCRWVLSHQSVSQTWEGGTLRHIVYVDQCVQLGTDAATRTLAFASYPAQPGETAYVIHTSGSTGQPKGVMVSHASLLNVLFSMQQSLGANQKDRWLALTAFSFDISLLELLLPLLTGARCILATEGDTKDPLAIMQLIKQHAITCLQATPTTWKMLLDAGYRPDATITVISGGEPLTREVGGHLIQARAALNGYGPTEATVYSTCICLDKEEMHMPSMSIGRPVANTKVYVLNRYLAPVPVGVPGELYIAGVGVAKGYMHQPHLTKERFIENPFDCQDNRYAILYKTGDKACWLPNGRLYFMGRMDHQFKLRGVRIEAGEIESALLQHEAVKDSSVLVKKIDDIESLVAYMTVYPHVHPPTAKALRAFLSKKLPPYMLPEKCIFLDVLPTTVSGKTDIKALQELPVKYVAVTDIMDAGILADKQQVVAGMWCQVLHVESVDRDDNFFDLGGNSIRALILVERINQHFGINLSIRECIEHPTLSGLCEVIDRLLKAQPGNEISRKTFMLVKSIQDPVVVLQSTGKGKPLFLIHPVGGNVCYYIPLVKRLAVNRPIYAIQDPGMDAKAPLFSSFTEMMRFYIDVIRYYQPNGPYYIAGSSFGANATIEIARQLYAQKETLAFIGLIDGWAKYPDRANHDRAWFEGNLKAQMAKMNTLLSDMCIPDVLLDICWNRQQLLAQYRLPKALAFDFTLFKAKETLPVLTPLESPCNRWEEYCSAPPTTHFIPGDHFTLHFEPHIDKFAAIFNQCLTLSEMDA